MRRSTRPARAVAELALELSHEAAEAPAQRQGQEAVLAPDHAAGWSWLLVGCPGSHFGGVFLRLRRAGRARRDAFARNDEWSSVRGIASSLRAPPPKCEGRGGELVPGGGGRRPRRAFVGGSPRPWAASRGLRTRGMRMRRAGIRRLPDPGSGTCSEPARLDQTPASLVVLMMTSRRPFQPSLDGADRNADRGTAVGDAEAELR